MGVQSVFTCSVEETSHHEAICRTFFDPGQCHGSSLWYHCSRCVVATHGVVANTVGAAVTQSHGPAPLATHPLKAGPVVPHPVNYVAPPAPAPYTTTAQGPGVTTIHQQAPVVTKQVHYGTTDFVSGYTT